MINSIFIFIFGLVSGCVAFYFLSKAYWAKRLAALKRSQTAQLAQYDSDRRQHQASAQRLIAQRNEERRKRDALEAGLKQSAQLKQQYEQQISTGKKERDALQAKFEQFQQDAEVRLAAQIESDRAAQQAELEKVQQDADSRVSAETEKGMKLAIDQTERIEAEKRSLQNKLQNLRDDLNASAMENERLRGKLEQAQANFKNELKQAHENSGLTFATVAEMTFTNLVILQDSAIEIDKHPEHAAGILHVLKTIDSWEFSNSKKVRATNREWLESKAKLGAVRIYFHIDKPISGQCEVLISNKKSQPKDFAYLKNRH